MMSKQLEGKTAPAAATFQKAATRGPFTPHRRRRGQITVYLWALPALILVIGVVHFGIAANGYYSLFDWSGVGDPTTFVGIDNYTTVTNDPEFWQSLGNTFVFAVVTVTVQMLLGLGLAVLVRTQTRLRSVLRTLVFVPVVLAPAVVATSFRFLLTPDGAFNQFLDSVGFSGFEQPWLADPKTALMTIMAINIWQYTGYSFLIYDAAIGQIDNAIFEAARIDGASTGQLVRLVVLPMLSGSHVVLVVLGFISSLKMFDLVFLTTGGGPGTTTQVLTGYIYQQVISQFHAGIGAAVSIVLVLIALLFAVLQVRLSTRESR
ncbi:carbohydrate ABC transporter permease [Arthrobacter bambusae]|uniref:Raffinose/stachyose/melibiose transport system permease protein n=2 Tax=Arthrobacter bambusae TaxID=1338426 RepID=A0AAW8DCM9_9MICC|nr:sugar ABC transporter permease [Arthrobacter bambusae]MDP9905543.1 raffinose/stachyose/melibiose transport system permease protein [Arthrobacter bambusae]MDQ0178717.1 raffinose/stachyose/melibiose transport system permease protein [Arthrobacter bambusae]